jgi:hypothetical protein
MAYEVGARVVDFQTGMVGTVIRTWDDDLGQWVSIDWDGSSVRAEDVRPMTEDD